MPGRGLADHGHVNTNMPGSNHLVVAVDKGQESSLMAWLQTHGVSETKGWYPFM